MQDLTDLRIFLASLLRPIINDAIKEELKNQQHPPVPTEQSDLLDIKGVSKLLSISVDGLYGKIHDKSIPFIKRKGVKKIYFSRQRLLEWLQEGEQKTRKEITEDVKKSLNRKNFLSPKKGDK